MTSALILAKENRIMITGIKGEIKGVRNDLGKMNTKLEEAFNHMSSRLPVGVTALITILGSLVTGLIVAGVMR